MFKDCCLYYIVGIVVSWYYFRNLCSCQLLSHCIVPCSSLFHRLDKRSSIVDLRVECQDLEKFSVINRFAKFHGRGQVDGTGTSSSDASSALKVCPQRYVTALPIPRNLPDRVQCLPLWSTSSGVFPFSWSICHLLYFLADSIRLCVDWIEPRDQF